jgi:uncharacterized protein YjiS (DUF1127 family)
MNVREFIRRLGDFRQLTRELTSYSDEELADLGIARPDVPRIAMRGAFAKATPPTASADTSVNPLTERKAARPRSTVRYLGIEVDDALAIAKRVEV